MGELTFAKLHSLIYASCAHVSADDFADTPWARSDDSGYCGFCFRWPITTLLWLTIPDCQRYPRLRLVTFGMCVAWIGATSYVVAFLITVVGERQICAVSSVLTFISVCVFVWVMWGFIFIDSTQPDRDD